LVIAVAHQKAFPEALAYLRNRRGAGGCKSSINAAIAAAGPNDTVAHGTYAENVIVNKSLALLGDNSANTTINANGLANGINIDGLANAGRSAPSMAGWYRISRDSGTNLVKDKAKAFAAVYRFLALLMHRKTNQFYEFGSFRIEIAEKLLLNGKETFPLANT
jgi:hypothetical protein